MAAVDTNTDASTHTPGKPENPHAAFDNSNPPPEEKTNPITQAEIIFGTNLEIFKKSIEKRESRASRAVIQKNLETMADSAYAYAEALIGGENLNKAKLHLAMILVNLSQNAKHSCPLIAAYKALDSLRAFFHALKFYGQITLDSGKACKTSIADLNDSPTEIGKSGDKSEVKAKKEKGMEAKQPTIKKFTDVLRELSEANQQKALEMLQAFKAKTTAQPKNLLPITNTQPEMPCPTTKAEMEELGMETYKEFKIRTGKADGKACLIENWKPWLKAITPSLDRDHMCRADLDRIDPPLLARLRAQYTSAELSQFLPTQPELCDQEIKAKGNLNPKTMVRDAARATKVASLG